MGAGTGSWRDVVIGIDADVHRIAWAAVRDGALLAVETVERANSRGRVDERYDQRLTALMRRAADVGAVVYLEGIYLAEDRELSQARNVQAFRALAEVQGEIKHEARRCSVPILVVAATQWHSNVLGFVRGREALKEAARTVAQSLAARELSEHEADAVCVDLYGERVDDAATGLARTI